MTRRGPAGALPAADEALVQQRPDGVRVCARNVLERVDAASAAERRERPEHPLLLVPEQAVRPVDGGLQRAMPLLGRPPRSEEVEVAAEPLTELADREQRRTCCSELDREREVVELPAQRRQFGDIGERRIELARPRDEQLDGVALVHPGYRNDVLAGQREALAARDAEPRAGHRGDQGDRVGDRGQEVLGVVDHDQELPAPEALGECAPRGLGARRRRAAPARSVAGTCNGFSSDASGTHTTPSGNASATPAAACSDSRVLPIPPGPVSVTSRTFSRSEQRGDLLDGILAPDEGGRRHRQIRPVERAQRREAGVAELVQAHRGRQVLETVLAEIDDVTGHMHPRRVRQDDLPAVRDAGDPCGAVDIEPDVAVAPRPAPCPA